MKKLIKLLKYELTHLLWCERTEQTLTNLFNMTVETGINLPCANYELLYMVLDKIGVPPDHEVPRDRYNDAYIQFMWDHLDEEDMDDNDIKKLIQKFKRISNGEE